jgi:hypothetical protein
MAIEYRLVLAGDTPVEQVAERALPDPDERPTGTAPLLVADLYDRLGFEVTVLASQNGYFDADSDTGTWLWKPATFVAVTFRLDSDADSSWAVLNMLPVVRRLLDTGSEDAAFLLNGDVLLLTRFGDDLVKHRARWWNNYTGANDQVPG